MASCFSYTATRDSCYRRSFRTSGLKPTTTDLDGDGTTIMHCWVPKRHDPSKPTLLMIHGFGANAMWQFDSFLPVLNRHFNLYVPDLLFFGDSFSSKPERSESFQARCVVALSRAQGLGFVDCVFGLSYGGFVAYRIASEHGDFVGRVVLGCAGVTLEENDMGEGLFRVKSVDEAVSVLLPQSPLKVRELIALSFHKPPPRAPSCFLNDFIQVMCTEYRQEKEELIETLHKDRKLADLPKITQPTLIIWGEYDQIFPLALAHRLKSHIGENAELVILKNAGHALNAEKPKELCKHLKSFLIDTLPQAKKDGANNGKYSNGPKAD